LVNDNGHEEGISTQETLASTIAPAPARNGSGPAAAPALTIPLTINTQTEPNSFDVKRKFFEDVARGKSGIPQGSPKPAFAQLSNGQRDVEETRGKKGISTIMHVPLLSAVAPLIQSTTTILNINEPPVLDLDPATNLTSSKLRLVAEG